MTICVGILCTDGIIIASDSMASSQILGTNNQKVYKLPFGIGAIAGSDFLGKFFVHELNKIQTIPDGSDPYQFTQQLANLITNQINTSNPGMLAQIYQMMLNQHQRTELFNFVNLTALIGFKVGSEYFLANFQPANFNSLFAACITTSKDRTFWQIIGSGYNTSAPLVTLLCDILNIKGKPSIQEGKILAYWLVKHAIDNAPQYIGGEVDIIQYSNSNAIEEIDYQECEELKSSLIEHIQTYSNPGNSKSVTVPVI